MSTEKLIENVPASAMSSTHSLRYYTEPATIFDELPTATIIGVSRPDASDISPLLLSYTIEVQYKQVKSLFLFFPPFQNSFHVLFFRVLI